MRGDSGGGHRSRRCALLGVPGFGDGNRDGCSHKERRDSQHGGESYALPPSDRAAFTTVRIGVLWATMRALTSLALALVVGASLPAYAQEAPASSRGRSPRCRSQAALRKRHGAISISRSGTPPSTSGSRAIGPSRLRSSSTTSPRPIASPSTTKRRSTSISATCAPIPRRPTASRSKATSPSSPISFSRSGGPPPRRRPRRW